MGWWWESLGSLLSFSFIRIRRKTRSMIFIQDLMLPHLLLNHSPSWCFCFLSSRSKGKSLNRFSEAMSRILRLLSHRGSRWRGRQQSWSMSVAHITLYWLRPVFIGTHRTGPLLNEAITDDRVGTRWSLRRRGFCFHRSSWIKIHEHLSLLIRVRSPWRRGLLVRMSSFLLSLLVVEVTRDRHIIFPSSRRLGRRRRATRSPGRIERVSLVFITVSIMVTMI